MSGRWAGSGLILLLVLGSAAGAVEKGMKAKTTTNRLINEKSPYLLQHAHNPVDWYPWGDAAFAAARAADKPIFLSIGYSTCHWCHVMERESFEDPEVAALMNETFISIKVDREERPDIDEIYMAVCQMLTGSGGWPLTVILTPDRKPFYAGTYFPKRSRYGRPGMLDLIPQIRTLWKDRRKDVLSGSEEIIAALNRSDGGAPGDGLGADVLDRAYQALSTRFDPVHGGFGGAPKFPSPHQLMFLLRVWRRTGDEKALKMVQATLRGMIRGGIFDQVGFGFHRYSTDGEWKTPHFEKMLYDQAMIVMALTETWQLTGDDIYRRAAGGVMTYLARDMADPGGGYYSAEDADSEGVEGKFYTWTPAEIEAVLPPDDAGVVAAWFHVTETGNFPEAGPGKNILYRGTGADWTPADADRWETIRKRLLAVRETRVRPSRDDKILTDWNGLMLAALAKAGRAFGDADYTASARRLARFVTDNLMTADGSLFHRYRRGEVGIPGMLDDYAFMAWGFIEMYETTFDPEYLRIAVMLNRRMITLFGDGKSGGFYTSASTGERLIVRRKDAYDGAVPSGNSVAMLNLARLARLTGDSDLERRAGDVGRAFSGVVTRAPSGFTAMLAAVDFLVGPSREIVISGDPGQAGTRAMLNAVRRRYLPNTVVLFHPSDGSGSAIESLAPFTVSHGPAGSQATAAICENFACRRPITRIESLEQELDAFRNGGSK